MARRLTGLFDAIAEPTALTLGFARVRENAGGPGGDGVGIDDFGHRLANETVALTSELISGSYVPRRPRSAEIPKRSGGLRTLIIPAVRDRVVQTAAATVLMAGLDPQMSPASFGYRPGRSVKQAVWQVDAWRRDGFRWAVDADIHAYFDSVPHDRLVRRLEERVDDRRFVDLVSLWLEAYGSDGRGLPQGSPISPVLANLYLDVLDDAMADKTTRIVRYADDFVILTRDAAGAELARDKAARVLAGEGLELHPEKTRIVPFERGFHFLGHVFVGSLVIEDPWDEAEAARPAGKPKTHEGDDEDDDRTGSVIRARRVLYLVTADTSAHVGSGDSLEVSEGGRPRLRLRPHMIERVEVYPQADITSDALRLLLAERVPVAFVDGRGAWLGSAGPRVSARGAVHLAQAGAVLDEARRRALAAALVEARIHNHRALLRRLNRPRGRSEVVRACEDINRVLRKLPGADGVASLMAYEGQSAKLYWAAFKHILPADWAFDGRQRRPPATPFDALLSYLAMVLTNDVERAVHHVGLHPGFAVLHASKDDDAACATDLVEQFRGPVAESCAVTLVAQKVVGLDGFTEDGEQGWRIADDTRAAVIRGYERTLARPVRDPFGASSLPWRGLIERQVRRFAEAISQGTAYRAYRMDY